MELLALVGVIEVVSLASISSIFSLVTILLSALATLSDVTICSAAGDNATTSNSHASATHSKISTTCSLLQSDSKVIFQDKYSSSVQRSLKGGNFSVSAQIVKRPNSDRASNIREGSLPVCNIST
ncbi:MAG: hypothetical protein OFPI_30520 [Osedax symbiont Rs2]|nr:MAG: hypothetical protein OFPI_30520 [Osedax symbiont Rs2]